MRFFRRRAAEPGEIGRVTAPDRHAAGRTPDGVRTDRDELIATDTPVLDYDARTARSWRSVQATGPLDGPAWSQPGVDAHTAPGSPDRRRISGEAGATRREDLAPSVSMNARVPEPMSVVQLQSQPSAGATTADATRPAEMPRYLFVRPFDQIAEYDPASLDRIYAASPVASRPLYYDSAAPGTEPYSGGSDATRQEAVPDFAQRLVRYLPSPHDDDTVGPTIDAGMSAIDARTRRGWR